MKIVKVTLENASEHSFFCIKNIDEPGFKAKRDWFSDRQKEGLQLKVIYADDGKQIGFIEYVPSEFAWRPIEADGYLFIHCIMVYPNKYRSTGEATALVNECVKEAKEKNLNGVCTFTSQKPWIATKSLFAKMGFEEVAKKGRFELMVLKFKENGPSLNL